MSKLTATKDLVDQQLEIFYFHLEKHQFKLQMLSSTTYAQEIKVLDKMMDVVNTISHPLLLLFLLLLSFSKCHLLKADIGNVSGEVAE